MTIIYPPRKKNPTQIFFKILQYIGILYKLGNRLRDITATQ
jgi:hypothetical protein